MGGVKKLLGIQTTPPSIPPHHLLLNEVPLGKPLSSSPASGREFLHPHLPTTHTLGHAGSAYHHRLR